MTVTPFKKFESFFFFGIAENATKYCFPNGTWMSKANYNACMPHGIADENDIEFQGVSIGCLA